MVARQRACRHFAPDPVPDDDVARILDAAVHAPSAENAQPWVFVVVRDADQRRRIAELTRRLWDGGAGQHSRPRLAADLFAEVDGSVRSGFGGAPVLVVVAGDGRDATTRRMLGASIFPAVQNLLLAANALGYGSALMTLATVASAELRQHRRASRGDRADRRRAYRPPGPPPRCTPAEAGRRQDLHRPLPALIGGIE